MGFSMFFFFFFFFFSGVSMFFFFLVFQWDFEGFSNGFLMVFNGFFHGFDRLVCLFLDRGLPGDLRTSVF